MSGGIVRIGPDNIIAEMRNWHIEANSNHNDGYIREHFQNHLEEVYKAVDDMRMSEEDKEIEAEKAKWVCEVCGKSTFDTDIEYLVSPTMHLGCQLKLMEDLK